MKSIAVLPRHYKKKIQAVSQPAVTRNPIGQRTIGPVSPGLGEGLARGALLGSLRYSDSLWRAGRLQVDFSHQLNGVSSGGSYFGGRMTRTLPRWGVAAMRQDRNWSAVGYHRIGEKRGSN